MKGLKKIFTADPTSPKRYPLASQNKSLDELAEYKKLITSIIRGEENFPSNLNASSTEDLLDQIDDESLAPLLYQKLKSTDGWARCSTKIQEALTEEFHCQNLEQLIRQREVVPPILEALAQKGITPFFLKGFALAHLVYPIPALRPSYDIDLLIRPQDAKGTRDVMKKLGYEFPNAVSGDLLTHEFSCRKTDKHGFSTVVDFHWKISNPFLFSEILTYEEIKKRSLQIPSIGEQARTLCFEHALLFALIHRVAHHADDKRLIWLYDIHLLWEKLGESEREEFLKMAYRKQIAAVCRRGLELAKLYFKTNISEEILESLKIKSEPSAFYLNQNYSLANYFLINLKTLPDFHQRTRFIFQSAFPSPDYMLRKYKSSQKLLLPIFYLARAVGGIKKLLK